MKAAGFARQEAAGKPTADCQDLGQDGHRDLFRGLGAERKPDWAVDPVAPARGEREAFASEVREQPFVAHPRTEDADVRGLPLQAEAKRPPVAFQVVAHHHGERAAGQREGGGQGIEGREDEPCAAEEVAAQVSGPWVHDRHGEAERPRLLDERDGILTGAEDHQFRGRQVELEKELGAVDPLHA